MLPYEAATTHRRPWWWLLVWVAAAAAITAGSLAAASGGSTAADDVAAIRRFVERSLDGSIAPVVAYLTETADLTDDDVRELQAAVARLQGGKKKETRS